MTTPTPPTSTVNYYPYDKPAVTDGDYELTVYNEVSISKDKGNIWETAIAGADSSTTLKFSVAGPRFRLASNQVQSTFPPNKSTGQYFNNFPSIILERSTLLWERKVDDTQQYPWLALLLFNEEELPAKSSPTGASGGTRIAKGTLAASDFVARRFSTAMAPPAVQAWRSDYSPSDNLCMSPYAGMALQASDDPGDLIHYVDVPVGLLWYLLPALSDLAWLGHMRQNAASSDNPLLPGLIGNRLPEAGKACEVHVVSLEGCGGFMKDLFGANADTYKADLESNIRLISLYSWRFACDADNLTFKGLLQNLDDNGGNFRLTWNKPGATPNSDALKFIDAAYTPHKHTSRQGNRMISWYRGPLITGNNPDQATTLDLPSPNADALVRYFSTYAMFDVSYAAAWELGRLLCLQNRTVSIGQFNWKRAYEHFFQRSADQQADQLPLSTGNHPPAIPATVSQWYQDLVLLKHLPFNYLVADESMLPVESIRFFYIDHLWIEALLDGAFSIGRVPGTEALEGQLFTALKQLQALPVTGMLLRSAVVSGWPHLQVNGYSDVIDNDDFAPPSDTVDLMRMDRVADDILLCLFGDEVKTVDIHERPEAIHFGLDYSGDVKDKDLVFDKEFHDPANAGKQSGTPNTIHWKDGSTVPSATNHYVVDLNTTITKSNLSAGIKNGAEFAVAMAEGVDLVRFTLTS